MDKVQLINNVMWSVGTKHDHYFYTYVDITIRPRIPHTNFLKKK